MARGEGIAMGEPASGGAPAPEIVLESIRFLSDHKVLRGCEDGDDWRRSSAPCPEPAWSRSEGLGAAAGGGGAPLSHTMGERIRMEVACRVDPGDLVRRFVRLRGRGPGGLRFESAPLLRAGDLDTARLISLQRLPRKIGRIQLDVDWASAGADADVSPARTSNLVYVTMDRPKDDRQGRWQEDGVTLKRMDRAVSWVAPLDTIDPHEIVAALLSRFPYYTLQPSPKVPKRYGHPRYFNNEGGAWALSEYAEESAECQAIARLIRGILRQLGVPGELSIVVVWADPNVDEGRTPIEADLEEDPSAGLDTTGRMNGRRTVAALVDGPVEVGKEYPPSHTRTPDGRVSPGLNRYEAFLRLSHRGKVVYYAPGAGIYQKHDPRLRVFWGLVWVSFAADDGFRVEKIVARYR